MVTSVQVAEKYRRRLMRRCTPQERKMKTILKSLGYKYKFQKVFPSPWSFYITDFFLPELSVIIECDGDYHSYNELQRVWDKRRDEYLSSIGLVVIRVNNHALSCASECKKTQRWLGRELRKIESKQIKLG